MHGAHGCPLPEGRQHFLLTALCQMAPQCLKLDGERCHREEGGRGERGGEGTAGGGAQQCTTHSTARGWGETCGARGQHWRDGVTEGPGVMEEQGWGRGGRGGGGALPSVSPVGRCCGSPAAARLLLAMAYFSSPWQLPISRCPDTQSRGCAFAGG